MRRALNWVLVLLATVAGATEPVDLTPAISSAAAWDAPELSRGWSRTAAEGTRLFRTRLDRCRILGVDATSVTGCFDNGRLTSLSVVLLDSGTWFGYVPDEQAKAVEAARAPEFRALFQQVSSSVTRSLAATGATREELVLGSTTWLKQPTTIFTSSGVGTRLTIVPDQLVKVVLFRNAADARELLAGFRRASDKTAQSKTFAALARESATGDRVINSLPVFPQGDRAYCGVSTLAVAMQFCGLTFDTEDYAAAAGIRFGSTRKSHIREVYVAAAKEGALQMYHSTKFEFARAQRTIDAGFPVLVFRRWNQERDFIHTAFARRIAVEPAIELPRADANDRKNWPVREGYAHASVVNGYNAKRQEVIFSESWSEFARNRRMRREELEATAYLAYYPRL